MRRMMLANSAMTQAARAANVKTNNELAAMAVILKMQRMERIIRYFPSKATRKAAQ